MRMPRGRAAARRAKSASDRKAAKAQVEKDAREKTRRPEPVYWVRRDQQRIATFLHYTAANYRDDDIFECEAELPAICSKKPHDT